MVKVSLSIRAINLVLTNVNTLMTAEYAQVLRMLGDGRVALQCYDDVARTGLIRGTMRRRVWINTVKYILCVSNSIFVN